jgi:hypothetical protein
MTRCHPGGAPDGVQLMAAAVISAGVAGRCRTVLRSTGLVVACQWASGAEGQARTPGR